MEASAAKRCLPEHQSSCVRPWCSTVFRLIGEYRQIVALDIASISDKYAHLEFGKERNSYFATGGKLCELIQYTKLLLERLESLTVLSCSSHLVS